MNNIPPDPESYLMNDLPNAETPSDETPNTDSINQLVDQVSHGKVRRRDFLRQAVAMGVSSAAAYSLLNQTTAQAQNATTFAVGEESTGPSPTTRAIGEENTGPPVTTQAIGEEGKPSEPYGEGTPAPTTYAVGEEQQPSHCYRHAPTSTSWGEEGQVTTQAYGEESTPSPITTHAMGEEGSVKPPTTTAWGEEQPQQGRPTTFAVGEEGSSPVTPPQNNNQRRGNRSSRSGNRIESTIRKQVPKVWNSFRRW